MTWSGRDALLQRWLPRFASRERLEMSISRYVEKSYALDDQRADEWVQRDHVRDAELATLIESYPSTFVPSDRLLESAIAHADLHDFRQDLEAHAHEVICPRCQLGIRSRLRADEIALALGKKPFPGLANVLRHFHRPDA